MQSSIILSSQCFVWSGYKYSVAPNRACSMERLGRSRWVTGEGGIDFTVPVVKDVACHIFVIDVHDASSTSIASRESVQEDLPRKDVRLC